MSVALKELLELVDGRHEDVRRFLNFAREQEVRAAIDGVSQSLRLENRADLRHACEAVADFAEGWWGVVVFTCFGSRAGAKSVAPAFPVPISPELAREALAGMTFPRGSVGHHRIQPGYKGAKVALISACERAPLFHDLIHADLGFDERYRHLRAERVPQWGRTTSFDLFLRTGSLGVGGHHYQPEIAYLADSTGPARGFRAVFGVTVTDETAAWAEAVLRAWTENWGEVAARVGADWDGDAYGPGDFENALCIFQER